MKRFFLRILSRFVPEVAYNFNPLSAHLKCSSKKRIRRVFEKNGIPSAEGKVFFFPFAALRFVRTHGFPVVLKPNRSSSSRGSFFPIRNWGEFWKAFFLTKIWWPTTVIERYLEGKNYRVVVTQNGIDLVSQRFPPFVVGDGKKTIAQLIDDENDVREEMGLFPVIHRISKGERTQKFLRSQGLTLDSIGQKDQRIHLFHRVALAPGGVLKTIEIESIAPKNREIFLKIFSLFPSNILGIDVIFEKGIEVDCDEQKCIFLEVNALPTLDMHAFPRWGNRPNVDKFIHDLEKGCKKD